MNQERNRQAGEGAQQDMLANERVAQSSLEHPAPGDERLRPQSPDVGLHREVEEPDEDAFVDLHRQVRVADQREPVGGRVRVSKKRGQHADSHDDGRVPKRALAIAAAETHVPAGQEHAAQHDGEHEERQEVLGDPFDQRTLRGRHRCLVVSMPE